MIQSKLLRFIAVGFLKVKLLELSKDSKEKSMELSEKWAATFQ